MSPTPRPSQGGFTILEVMVAIAILTVGLASVFGSMGTAKMCSDRARNRDLAMNAMQTLYEDMQSNALSTIDSFYAAGSDKAWFDVKGLGAPAGRTKVGHISLVAGNGWQRQIQIETSWVDQEGPQTLSLVYFHVDRTSAE